MQNEVLLEETGILNSIYHGDQTDASINGIAEAAKPLIEQCRLAKKKVLILIDVRDIHGQTAAARKAALDQLNFLDYDKLAIFGAKTFIKQIIVFLIAASGKKEKVRYFNTEEEARAWLLS
jgi:hypothetical protein